MADAFDAIWQVAGNFLRAQLEGDDFWQAMEPGDHWFTGPLPYQTDDQELLKLARAWLLGYHPKLTDKHPGLPGVLKFVDEKDDEPHRRALAILLLSGKPLPSEIRVSLAQLIAPDNVLGADERRLEFRFRNRSRTRPRSGSSGATAARDGAIVTGVMLALRERKVTVEEAVEAIAKELSLSESTVRRAWMNDTLLRVERRERAKEGEPLPPLRPSSRRTPKKKRTPKKSTG